MTNNEYPYTEYQGRKVVSHHTLRANKGHTTKDLHKRYRTTHLSCFEVVENEPEKQSVPSRPHIHILYLE